MMNISRKEMLKRIPEYPNACSLINLAAYLGYIDKEMDLDRIAEVLQKMERKLFWPIISNKRIVGAEMKTQRSTRLALTGFGFKDSELFPTGIYLSIDNGGGGSEN